MRYAVLILSLALAAVSQDTSVTANQDVGAAGTEQAAITSSDVQPTLSSVASSVATPTDGASNTTGSTPDSPITGNNTNSLTVTSSNGTFINGTQFTNTTSGTPVSGAGNSTSGAGNSSSSGDAGSSGSSTGGSSNGSGSGSGSGNSGNGSPSPSASASASSSHNAAPIATAAPMLMAGVIAGLALL